MFCLRMSRMRAVGICKGSGLLFQVEKGQEKSGFSSEVVFEFLSIESEWGFGSVSVCVLRR